METVVLRAFKRNITALTRGDGSKCPSSGVIVRILKISSAHNRGGFRPECKTDFRQVRLAGDLTVENCRAQCQRNCKKKRKRADLFLERDKKRKAQALGRTPRRRLRALTGGQFRLKRREKREGRGRVPEQGE